jgi:hypothetical protein
MQVISSEHVCISEEVFFRFKRRVEARKKLIGHMRRLKLKLYKI